MLQFRHTPHSDFLLFHLQGIVSLEAWQQVLEELHAELQPMSGDRMVLDLTGLLGWLGIPERRAVGGHMALHFARMNKVALVIQREKITDVVKAEAQRQGLNLHLFSDYDEAAGWVVS